MTVNTVSEMTSANTFSWKSVKGPPFPMNPYLLAGTMKLYSNNAIPQDSKTVAHNGQLVVIPNIVLNKF